MKEYLSRHPVVLPLAVLLVACLITVLMVMQKEPVQKKPAEMLVPKVPVQLLRQEALEIPIYVQGVVEPRKKIKLLSEVNGRIQEASERWVNGGFFHKGDVLLGIEEYYYQNQLARAKASLAQAKSALTQEEGFSYVARQDWERRNPEENNSAAKSLALREPQLATARAQFEAANADVVSAERVLAKTRISAPFDGVVVNKVADIGQYVSPGLALAELYAIDVVEIRVPLTEAQQSFLNLPALSQTAKIPAEINYHTPVGTEIWKGHLVRTEGVLDPVSKVLNGVVQINDPYGLNKPVKSPLRLGTFVEIKLQGKKLENIFVIPRRFLFSGNVVWLVDAENKLRSRAVKVLPIREENVYIQEGLSAGEKLVSGGVVGLLDGKLVEPVIVGEASQRKNNE